MRKRKLPFNRLTMLVALLAALGVLVGWLSACGYYGFLPITIILLLFVAWRTVSIYRRFISNLDFIFNAVSNNDFSFRFVDNQRRAGNSVLNYSLNRIKEVLDEAKIRTANSEKFFEAIIECANIGIIILTENGSVAKINRKALNLLGFEMLSHVERLRPLSAELVTAMNELADGEQRNIRFSTETGEITLLLNCSSVRNGVRSMRVMTIENINRELDTQEGVAWEKLTRILTHEIMNSLAPVTSISNTLLHGDCSKEKQQHGLETIYSTSDRLMKFVGSFRSVTRIPSPHKAPFYLVDLVNEVVSLTELCGIDINVDISPADTMLYADRGQISQVLVNLLKNAVEASLQYNGNREIEVRSHIDNSERVHIEVVNNGDAIPPEIAENIFTPFFTTKRDGSGIGLAVSKQIIRLHGGSLHLVHNGNGKVAFLVVLE